MSDIQVHPADVAGQQLLDKLEQLRKQYDDSSQRAIELELADYLARLSFAVYRGQAYSIARIEGERGGWIIRARVNYDQEPQPQRISYIIRISEDYETEEL